VNYFFSQAAKTWLDCDRESNLNKQTPMGIRPLPPPPPLLPDMSTKNVNTHQEDNFDLESSPGVSENEWEAQVQATTKGQEEDNDVISLTEKSQNISLNEAQEEPSSSPPASRVCGTRKFKIREAQQKPSPPVMTMTGSVAAALRVSRKKKTFSLSELTDSQAKKALALVKK